MTKPSLGGSEHAQANSARPTVVVYTHSLLERSMTFIQSHAEALTAYKAIYAGAHRAEGIDLPSDRVITANQGGVAGKFSEFLFRRFGMAESFARRLRRFSPTVVHAHFGPSGPSALALAKSLGVPLVLTYHGQDATISDDVLRRSWRGREYLRGREAVIRSAAQIIAVSDFIHERLLAKGYPPDKIITHRNGINLRDFQRSGQVREPIVVFVGRFVEKKGCKYLIESLALLRRQGCSARGIMIGDGPDRASLERLVADCGADIVFTGFQASPEVREWLARASVVAVPSVTAANGDSEGLPTVILEAQAMETPVIVTRHAGNAEGIDQGQSGCMVEERDIEGLAKAIQYFLEDADAVRRFGSAGRTYVESHFDIRTQARGLEEIYDRARGLVR